MARDNRHVTNGSPASAVLVPRPSVRWSTRIISILSAVLIVVAIVVVNRWLTNSDAGAGWIPDPPAPEGLEATVADFLGQAPCAMAAEAQRALPAHLERAGYAGWSVRVAPDVKPDSCVSATVDTVDRQVVLIRGVRSALGDALEEVRAELMSQCLGREGAAALLETRLRALGESGFEIRSDGPLAAPLDQKDEVLGHVNAGCWVYSTSGRSADGGPVYYISGR